MLCVRTLLQKDNYRTSRHGPVTHTPPDRLIAVLAWPVWAGLIGLFTRPVAFVLRGDMAVAYFMAHWPKNWLPLLNGGELAVLFCFGFLHLAVAGAGPWSADAMRRK